MLTLLEEVNFTTHFFSCDKMPIDTKILVFFLGKCVWIAAETMVVDKKNKEGTSSAIFGVGTTAKYTANSSVVPTEFTAGPTTRMKLSKGKLELSA